MRAASAVIRFARSENLASGARGISAPNAAAQAPASAVKARTSFLGEAAEV
jgi:hypothetical protein